MPALVPRLLTPSVLVVVLILAALAAPPAHAADLLTWKGRVTHVSDGDTIDVDIDGDGLGPRRIRLAGIQAMELQDYYRKTGECHAPEADRRLTRIVDGKRVRLRAFDPASRAGDRLLRYVEVRRAGRWRDVGRIMIRRGHAIWSPHNEYARDRSYALAQARAQRDARRLWNPRYCGVGPAQTIPITMRVNYDADGNDETNLNGEWVRIANGHPNASLSLRGWKLRDGALRWFTFPLATSIPPGGAITVHVGSGSSTGSRLYWGEAAPLFSNLNKPGRFSGDGAFLFDPHGDVRAAFTYPCMLGCT